MCCLCIFFFFKQKTAYELRISDWSSDVCSSDLFSTWTSKLLLGTGSISARMVRPQPPLHECSVANHGFGPLTQRCFRLSSLPIRPLFAANIQFRLVAPVRWLML